MPDDYKLDEFMQTLQKGYGAFDINLMAPENFESLLQSTGFANIVAKVWKVPIGTWPTDRNLKKTGLYNLHLIHKALQNLSLAPFTRGFGWSAAEVEIFLVDVRKALANSSIHAYYTFHSYYGQKPDIIIR